MFLLIQISLVPRILLTAVVSWEHQATGSVNPILLSPLGVYPNYAPLLNSFWVFGFVQIMEDDLLRETSN